MGSQYICICYCQKMSTWKYSSLYLPNDFNQNIFVYCILLPICAYFYRFYFHKQIFSFVLSLIITLFVLANISPNNRICSHVCQLLANQNIFTCVFDKKVGSQYICICYGQKMSTWKYSSLYLPNNFNQNIFVFILWPVDV